MKKSQDIRESLDLVGFNHLNHIRKTIFNSRTTHNICSEIFQADKRSIAPDPQFQTGPNATRVRRQYGSLSSVNACNHYVCYCKFWSLGPGLRVGG
jgi:hypothetical protein